MLLLALLLTTATVLVELMLLYRSDSLLAAFKRSAISAVVSSVVLSWVLGALFGAAGMIVFLSAIASTVVTALIYKSGLLIAVKRLERMVSGYRSTRA